MQFKDAFMTELSDWMQLENLFVGEAPTTLVFFKNAEGGLTINLSKIHYSVHAFQEFIGSVYPESSEIVTAFVEVATKCILG